jgi:carbamoyl-phosphate synthase large subunit
MDKLNILIIGVGGNVSQGIIRALEKSNLKYKCIGACISSESLGLYMCDIAYICPLAKDKDFIGWLINICNKEKVDIVLSGVEEVLEAISANYNILKENTQSQFISSPYEQIRIGQDKLLTCEWLKANNCNYPRFAVSDDAAAIKVLENKCGYPLIAKPRKGKGSSGIKIIYNPAELIEISNRDDYIVQEYLGNKDSEYTVGCYVNPQGEFKGMIILKRELQYGTTYMAEVVHDKTIYEEALKICNAFKPIGPLNIQLRIHNNIPVCFELNVRYSGTTPIRAHFGFNDVEIGIREMLLKETIEKPFDVKEGKVYRYWNEFYIDKKIQSKLQK